MKKIKFSSLFPPIILLLLCLFISFKAYTPNTFLTGWDTLHPEFNFPLNFKRLINIWHSEQGLGAIPAHAQVSELPRIFILWLFSFIFPLNFLRYSYIFLCFIAGPFGIYFLIKKIFQKSINKNLIAFLSSLLYIFNLSTIQQFYVPFEMFPTQWAFMPFILLFSLKFLTEKKNSKNLIFFSLFTILAAPQAYASQLFYAFFIIYSLFLIIYSFLKPKKLKKSLILILFTLLLNAFWLIPNLFYILSSSQLPQQNHDNRLYSQEYLLKNRKNGTLSDSTIIKGFYFDWSAFNFSKNTFKKLMPEWQQHLQNIDILIIGYLIFILSTISLIISFLKKNKLFISLSPFFIIPFILLANQVPPFSYLFNFLIRNSTIKESFRFIFTKLSILLLFALVLFFSYFLNFIFKKIKTKKSKIIFSFIITISLIIYAFPLLQGKLISPIVKIDIPQQYFESWQFMKKQDDGRVLTLPLNQSSGWQYYSWNYQGSGFLWFNLKQSLLDRDFDRWNHYNEQSYRELFNSLYSQDLQQFTKSLQKYQIKYIIWDQNLINSAGKNNDQITFKNESEKFIKDLKEQNTLKLIKQFDSIFIYQTNIDTSLLEIKNINNFVNPSYQWAYFDFANPDYLTINTKETNYYPFRDLLSKNQKINLSKIDIKEQSSDQWQITLKNNNSQLKIPSIISTEKNIYTPLFIEKKENNYQLSFEFPFPKETLKSIQNQFELSTTSSKIKINNSTFNINPLLNKKTYLGHINIFTDKENYINNQLINFNFKEKTTIYLKNLTFNSQSITFTPLKTFKNYNDTEDYFIDLSDLPNSFGYILAFKSQYVSGIPLRVCLKNNHSLLCSLEDQLDKNIEKSWDYFLIPSTGKENFGYKLNISNISYGNQSSESILEKIAIIPIPFQLLSQSKSNNQSSTPSRYLIFNQSFHKNWKAYYFQGIKPIFLKKHSLANNWANAWEIPEGINSSQIHLIFWPQLLQYLAFGLTISTFIYLLRKKK